MKQMAATAPEFFEKLKAVVRVSYEHSRKLMVVKCG